MVLTSMFARSIEALFKPGTAIAKPRCPSENHACEYEQHGRHSESVNFNKLLEAHSARTFDETVLIACAAQCQIDRVHARIDSDTCAFCANGTVSVPSCCTRARKKVKPTERKKERKPKVQRREYHQQQCICLQYMFNCKTHRCSSNQGQMCSIFRLAFRTSAK
jgi:hypothetical protein